MADLDADLEGGHPPPPPLILGKKKITEGRKAGRASKPASPLA